MIFLSQNSEIKLALLYSDNEINCQLVKTMLRMIKNSCQYIYKYIKFSLIQSSNGTKHLTHFPFIDDFGVRAKSWVWTAEQCSGQH